MVDKIMVGVCIKDIEVCFSSLYDFLVDDDYLFYMDLMLNLYFICDFFVLMGNGMIVNKMIFEVCCCELMFIEYILKYYLRFVNKGIEVWLDCENLDYIEGGDELILSDKVVVVGIF